MLLDDRGTFKDHFRSVGNKACAAFNNLRRVSGSTLGLDFMALRVLYVGLFESIMLYVWAQRLELQYYRRLLNRSQRLALLALTKAYRTVSGEALTVIAGVQPSDISAWKRAEKYRLKRSGQFTAERSRGVELAGFERWQQSWDAATVGRHTHAIFPDVRRRCVSCRIRPGHKMTQILSGHGDFQAKLYSFRLVADPNCQECGQPETVSHVLYDCVRYAYARDRLLRDLQRLELDFDVPALMFSTAGLELI